MPGTVGHLAYLLDLRTPPPPVPSIGNPSTPKHWQGVGMVIKQSDRIACPPGRVVGGGQSSDTPKRLIRALEYSVIILRRNRAIGCS
jgi:hypothetical protein